MPRGKGAGQCALWFPDSRCVYVCCGGWGGDFSCVTSCFCDSRGWRERGRSLSSPE